MGTIGHASSRILIKALRLSIFMQFILGFASGVWIPASNGVEHSLEATVANQHGHNNGWHFSFMSKIMFMAVPGMVLFSCAFPCFWRRRRNAQASLHGDPVSMDSGSSFGMTSSSDRILGSPMRYPPQSPMKFPPHSPRFSPKLSKLGPVHLSFNQVAKATQNFSSSACIGEGGFGTVYKGRLPDGQEVAIKRARKDHFDSTEFNSEVDILSKIDHRNLVRLLGCVDRGNERLIITEYVSNGTLRQHLDGERGKSLDFNQRLEISIDITHGLTYLHTYADKQIIHRDVKSSNILLTDNMKAKVADFGFARIGPRDADRTHISTKVKGTVGYLDPDYMRTYQLTTKSDVYSFGILLLEILTGRRPVDPRRPLDERVLIKWAFYNYSEGNIVGIIDPQMQESVNEDILRKMFNLAIQCAAPIRTDRPDMKSVGERLWAVRMDYKSGKGPKNNPSGPIQKQMDFTLKVVGGDLSSIPGIYDAIEGTIRDAIEDSITWPIRKVIPILPGDYSDLEMKPDGILRVKLVQARHLTNKDLIGKSDPFTELYVRPIHAKTKKSKGINNDLNPIWNEHFEFVVEEKSTQILVVKIYDYDKIQDSELIGCAQFQLKDLQPGKVKEVWLKLVKDLEIQRDNKNRGEVHLELVYTPKAPENGFTNPYDPKVSFTALERVLSTAMEEMSSSENGNKSMPWGNGEIIRGVLSVTLISAQGLPPADLNGKADPYVLVKMKKSETRNKTRVVHNSLDPVWNQTFDFLVENGLHDMLMLEVWDHDAFGKDYMGRSVVTLTRVITEGEYSASLALEGAKGRLNVHLKWTPQYVNRNT